MNFQNKIGRTRIERRIKVLAGHLKQELAKIPGVKIQTPTDPYLSAGLTKFSADGVDSARLVEYLRDKYNLVVRTAGSPAAGTYGVRVSTPIYVSTKEVDMVVDAVKTLIGHRA